MLADVLPFLACPHCGGGFGAEAGALRCRSGHAFDVARQGYVTLLPSGAAPGGDSAAMVAARSRVHGAGHFAPLTQALATAVASADVAGCVLDVGAGTGHHLAAALDAAPGRVGIALDASRYAARRAARAHPRIGAVVADAWRGLPVRAGAAAVLLDVFSPRNGAEMRRVLAPGGTLLVVTPRQDHLAELVGPLGLLTVDERKAARLAGAFEPHLAERGHATRRWTMRLTRAEVADAVGMGPSAHHVDPDETRRRIDLLADPLTVTAAVDLRTYVPCG